MKQTSMQYLRARYDGGSPSIPAVLFVVGWLLTIVALPVALVTPAYRRKIRSEVARRRAFLAVGKQGSR